MPLRLLATVVLLLVAITAASQPSTIPPPLTGNIPVSAGTLTAAAGEQTGPMAASNGDVTLVVWSDDRAGTAAFAARIAADGTPLDPAGIPLGAWSAGPLVWNGESFSVLTLDGTGKRVMMFVSPDGAVLGRKTLNPPAVQLAVAVSGEGANARFLFVSQSGTAVFDARGELVNEASLAPSLVYGQLLSSAVATPAGRGFLLLVKVNPLEGAPYAVRLDEAGRVISWVPSTLPFTSWGHALLSADPGGFVVVTRSWLNSSTILAYRLDPNGVYTGKAAAIVDRPGGGDWSVVHQSTFDVVWSGDAHLIAWRESGAAGHSFLNAARVGTDMSIEASRQIRELVGGVGSVAFVRDFAQPLLFAGAWAWPSASGSDLWVQRILPGATIETSAPRVVTHSAARQFVPRVATSPAGHAVAWTEVGPDQFTRSFVRRFTRQGAPYDLAPLEVARTEAPMQWGDSSVKLIAAGDSYAVVWRRAADTLIRRLGSSPDSWRDLEPLKLTPSSNALFATDGDDLLAFDSVACETSKNRVCVASRRISLGPTLLVGEPVILAPTERLTQFAASFNGSEYLLVWTETSNGVLCTCPPPDARVLALRVRRDGTAIDSEPLVLDGWKPGSSSPAVAWDGGRWVAAWIEGLRISAVTVSREGAASGPVVVRQGSGWEMPAEVMLAPRRAGVALFTRTRSMSETSRPMTLVWEVATFAAGTPLQDLAASPRAILSTAAESSSANWSLAAATRGDEIVIAFDAPAGRDAGFAQRVFSRIYAELSRRRSVSR